MIAALEHARATMSGPAPTYTAHGARTRDGARSRYAASRDGRGATRREGEAQGRARRTEALASRMSPRNANAAGLNRGASHQPFADPVKFSMSIVAPPPKNSRKPATSPASTGAAAPESEPSVTVLRDRFVPSPVSESAKVERDEAGNVVIPPGSVLIIPLALALARKWPTDAHACAYEPMLSLARPCACTRASSTRVSSKPPEPRPCEWSR